MNKLILTACLCLASFAPGVMAQGAGRDGGASASARQDGGAPINALCPVSGDEEVDPRFTVEYGGKTIGLCCRKCVTKFKADPEAYITNLPGFDAVSLDVGGVPLEPGPGDDHDGLSGEAGHGDGSGHSHDGDHGDGVEADGHGGDEHGDADGGGHDHATDHDRSGSAVVAWLGKLHPPATHLPIGMLLGAALAEVGLMLTGRDLFRHAAAFCVALAAVGAVGAVSLGWLAGGFVLIDGDWVQATHRWLGTSTALLSLVALAVLVGSSGRGDGSRRAFRVVLFLAAGLVGVTGFFGGALVYGLNHYAL